MHSGPTKCAVCILSSSSVSEDLQFILASVEIMFEGSHYGTFYVWFDLYAFLIRWSRHILIWKMAFTTCFCLKQCILPAYMLYIRPASKKAIKSTMKKIRDHTSSICNRFHTVNCAFLSPRKTVEAETMITKKGCIQITKPFLLRSGFVRPRHIQESVSG